MMARGRLVQVLLALVVAATVAGGCLPSGGVPTPEPAREPAKPKAATEAFGPAQATESLPEESAEVTMTVVYDNNDFDRRLRTSWGFSCLLEVDHSSILFDTGGDGEILLGNMSVLGLDPMNIDIIVLSHSHSDHTGGLAAVLSLGARPTVYMPRSFPASFKNQVRSWTEVREVSEPITIMDGVYSTGELGSEIIEQSLILSTARGLVVVTGCAHPGIVETVRRAKQLHDGEIYLVIGGFHLGGESSTALERIIAELRQLGVQKLAPCHCTGDQAMAMFAREWDSNFIVTGVGRAIEIDASPD
jgi:7,8-dihydropterin-6-yl-methyl-4-(beta-D-ribofuranosyl)aminobenzene 5'-phosphate synthase